QNASPAVDSVVFPATHFSGSRYWSSTTDVSNALSALAIDFSDSTIYSTGKTGNHYVRCVR
ncbi:MAG: DUF1566 domain-containing protein, partial [Leptospiraceae bacterium]|nr:DUF1566 domain-containing protein [Leptospiraceae bacterium]